MGGHSAGGHLAAMMLSVDWMTEAPGTADLIKGRTNPRSMKTSDLIKGRTKAMSIKHLMLSKIKRDLRPIYHMIVSKVEQSSNVMKGRTETHKPSNVMKGSTVQRNCKVIQNRDQ